MIYNFYSFIIPYGQNFSLHIQLSNLQISSQKQKIRVDHHFTQWIHIKIVYLLHTFRNANNTKPWLFRCTLHRPNKSRRANLPDNVNLAAHPISLPPFYRVYLVATARHLIKLRRSCFVYKKPVGLSALMVLEAEERKKKKKKKRGTWCCRS